MHRLLHHPPRLPLPLPGLHNSHSRPSLTVLTTLRPSFSTTTFSSQPKDPNDTDKKSALLDREAVNTESNEYSKSGSDDSAASEGDPAFKPGRTDPESQLEESSSSKEGKEGAGGGEGAGNPLNVSPANHEISQPRGRKEGGAESGPARRKGSGGGGGEMKRGKVG